MTQIDLVDPNDLTVGGRFAARGRKSSGAVFVEVLAGGGGGGGGSALSDLLFTDDTGAYFIRRDNGTDISWTNIAGADSAAPGTGAKPVSTANNIVVQTLTFTAIASATGYTTDDILERVFTLNPTTGVPISNFWFNASTGLKLASSPSGANVRMIVQQVQNVDQDGAPVDYDTPAKVQVYFGADEVNFDDPATVVSPPPGYVTGVIANTASLSPAIQIDGKLVAIKFPAALNDTPDITFMGSIDGNTTYAPIYESDGTERKIANADIPLGGIMAVHLNDWLGFTHIKIRTGTSETAVNQTASRTFGIAKAG